MARLSPDPRDRRLRALVRTVPCPYCGAGRGKKCLGEPKRSTGERAPRSSSHMERWEAFRTPRGAAKGRPEQSPERSKKEPMTIPSDPCPGCAPGYVCRTPACGRLRASAEVTKPGTVVPLGGLAPERRIVPPSGGWKAHTLYLVHVSYRSTNPVHAAYLEVGFLDERGQPGSYSELFCNSYEQSSLFSRAYYLQSIKELHTRKP